MSYHCEECDQEIGSMKDCYYSTLTDKILCEACWNALPYHVRCYDANRPIDCERYGSCSFECEEQCESWKQKQRQKKLLEVKQ